MVATWPDLKAIPEDPLDHLHRDQSRQEPVGFGGSKTIPMRALSVFSEIIVAVDAKRLFLEPEANTIFAKRELIAELGEDALRESGLLDADGRLKTEATSDGA